MNTASITSSLGALTLSANGGTGVFQIGFDRPYAQVTYTVLDLVGKVIAEGQIENSMQYQLNLQTAPKGTYLLRVNTGEGFRVSRLIIE